MQSKQNPLFFLSLMFVVVLMMKNCSRVQLKWESLSLLSLFFFFILWPQDIIICQGWASSFFCLSSLKKGNHYLMFTLIPGGRKTEKNKEELVFVCAQSSSACFFSEGTLNEISAFEGETTDPARFHAFVSQYYYSQAVEREFERGWTDWRAALLPLISQQSRKRRANSRRPSNPPPSLFFLHPGQGNQTINHIHCSFLQFLVD